MSLWYTICNAIPLEMLQWDFMKNALLAIILITPLFGMLGTMAVDNKMAFFSDALGHSALTGIAIGVVLGWQSQMGAMLLFGILWAVLITFVKHHSKMSADTIISDFSSTSIALGLVDAGCSRGHGVDPLGRRDAHQFAAHPAGGGFPQCRKERGRVYAHVGHHRAVLRRGGSGDVVLPQHERGRCHRALLRGGIFCDSADEKKVTKRANSPENRHFSPHPLMESGCYDIIPFIS